ncbi:hypothetical protein ZOSMA_16G01190 [Zostera marina]|uniref:Uncharacterized protein n=1 Tax=Zostera marina TaxID=29655 RepID=A0A0K9PT64_ZOSMR|nr:hypothetical protein ZOSMA_16G01190 [Zostera marina]
MVITSKVYIYRVLYIITDFFIFLSQQIFATRSIYMLSQQIFLSFSIQRVYIC